MEKFDAQNRQYYTRADCILLVYDITDRDSFEQISDHYIKEIEKNCKKDIQVILLGNKSDLQNQRKVSQEEGATLADKNNYMFKETSCERNYNVADAFEALIILTNSEMIKKENNANEKISITPNKGNQGKKINQEVKKPTIVINKENNNTEQKKSGGCC